MRIYMYMRGWGGRERRLWVPSRSTHEKAEYQGRENGNDGPNAEEISNGGDPGIRVIVPKIVDVPVPDIGGCSEYERHD
jgi:hypothetical protein